MQFLRQHGELAAGFCSLLWFLAGKQSSSNGSPSAALFWQSVGVFIAGALLVVSLAKGVWLGLLVSAVLPYVEVPSVTRLVVDLGQRAK